MSKITSLLPVRLTALFTALGFAILPLVAHATECDDDCHAVAMEIEDVQGGPMWDVANYVYHRCIEEKC